MAVTAAALLVFNIVRGVRLNGRQNSLDVEGLDWSALHVVQSSSEFDREVVVTVPHPVHLGKESRLLVDIVQCSRNGQFLFTPIYSYIYSVAQVSSKSVCIFS